MKTVFARRFGVFLLGFILLFIFRFGFGYVDQPNGVLIEQNYGYASEPTDFALSLKNYAGQGKRVRKACANQATTCWR